MRIHQLLGWLVWLVWLARADPPASAGALSQSRVVEVAGVVEFRRAGPNAWQPATNGLALKPGDRLRTGAQSRAAVQFSDRSMFRLGERTTLEIQPPRRTEQRRFGLPAGLLFFFNRERPAEVEFETPIATGAIRGTEFVLEVEEATGTTRLALLDGEVDLVAEHRTLNLRSGSLAHIEPGQPPRQTALVDAANIIQWALYYPAVVNPEDLALTPEDDTALAGTLEAYRAGDLLTAHAALSNVPPGGEPRELFRSALDLAVGQVALAEARLAALDTQAPVARALREWIETTRGNAPPVAPHAPAVGEQATDRNQVPAGPAFTTATEWLARSYSLQSRFRLAEALQAARQAVAMAPRLGFAHARTAELEWALEHRQASLQQLARALQLSPRLASAHALQGFIRLEQHDVQAALGDFDHALALDSGFGSAWLGQGLALMRLGRRDEALRSFQAAVALEPRRALHRSYLGKAWSEQGEPRLADKEFRLAQSLDPHDPTAWLYSALHHGKHHRPNAAIRDLERSTELNDNRRLFRSRLALDRDLAVRNANLATLYRDAGLPEVGFRSAARAVQEDYANFAGHLFLADTYRTLEDPNRFDLRFETARQSEQLLANLLAPAGAADLSRLRSDLKHLHGYEQRPVGVRSSTEYRSTGDAFQQLSVYGSAQSLSYALDGAYETKSDTGHNDWLERGDVSFQFKQRVSVEDELYFQAGSTQGRAGDVARHTDPADANPTLHVTEEQWPNLQVGWHRAWTPASHTLFLFARQTDALTLTNGQQQVLFLRDFGGVITRVSTDEPGFDLHYASDFTLYSGEVQHLWQTERHALVAGGRLQTGDLDTRSALHRNLTDVVADQETEESLERGNAYAYWNWHVVQPLRLVAGLSYDHLTYPLNTETVPLTEGDTTRELLAPKAGFQFAPWRNGLGRGAFTRSLGGLLFDPSVRLEPAQIAGFNQAYRSLAPESVAGLVPGTEFDTLSLGFDQSWRTGTYCGVEIEQLASAGDRTVGALTNDSPAPVPNAIASTRQTLDFRERNLQAYAVQLLGDGVSVGARYRLSEAKLATMLPDIPRSALNLSEAEQDERAVLHQLSLMLHYRQARGFFAQWESRWIHQDDGGPAVEDLWQHQVWAGWRFPRHRAEVRVGLLNITDSDYRLNPLNRYGNFPRERTTVVNLRLHF